MVQEELIDTEYHNEAGEAASMMTSSSKWGTTRRQLAGIQLAKFSRKTAIDKSRSRPTRVNNGL